MARLSVISLLTISFLVAACESPAGPAEPAGPTEPAALAAPPSGVPSEEKTITSIRERFTATNAALEGLKETVIEGGWPSTEGNHATVYSGPKGIVAIKGGIMGEMYRVDLEYYYDGGAPYFAFFNEITYNRPMYLEEKEAGPLEETPHEYRYYYDGERLVRWLGPDGKRLDPAKAPEDSPMDGPKGVREDAVRLFASATKALAKP